MSLVGSEQHFKNTCNKFALEMRNFHCAEIFGKQFACNKITRVNPITKHSIFVILNRNTEPISVFKKKLIIASFLPEFGCLS